MKFDKNIKFRGQGCPPYDAPICSTIAPNYIRDNKTNEKQ